MSESNIKESALTADVLIIGAGIMGLYNALQYAKRDFKVVLIDNIVNQKRSYKVGESLLIFSNPFLRTIGELDDYLEESFPKSGVWFNYGMEGAESFADKTEWAFQSTLPDRWYDAMENKKLYRSMFYDAQFVRPEAEDCMRETVYAHKNITFIDTARVRDVEIPENKQEQTKVSWRCQDSGTDGKTAAKWVIDCSGRNRFLAKKFQHDVEREVLDDDFKTTALWAQFDGITDELFGDLWEYTFQGGETTKRDYNTCHLWGDGYWIWIIRLAGDRISVGVIYDHRTKHSFEGKKPKEQYWEVINRYPVLKPILTGENILEFRMYQNVQYMTDTFVSPRRYGMVGDAASIMDAYYSQGISVALKTSWHIANIIEDDLRNNQLDKDYIDKVNRATVQDWLMTRDMVKEKYTSAIKDSRFFILSHLLDITIFSSIIVSRWQIVRWLVETEGNLANEKKVHQIMRRTLKKRLYYSQTAPWHFLSPESVRKIHGWVQKRLGDRARWRNENGIHPPSVKSVTRVMAPIPKLQGLLRKKGNVDISGKEMKEPAWIRLTGRENKPLPMRFGGIMLLTVFSLGFIYDGISTTMSKVKIKLKHRGGIWNTRKRKKMKL